MASAKSLLGTLVCTSKASTFVPVKASKLSTHFVAEVGSGLRREAADGKTQRRAELRVSY